MSEEIEPFPSLFSLDEFDSKQELMDQSYKSFGIDMEEKSKIERFERLNIGDKLMDRASALEIIKQKVPHIYEKISSSLTVSYLTKLIDNYGIDERGNRAGFDKQVFFALVYLRDNFFLDEDMKDVKLEENSQFDNKYFDAHKGLRKFK